VILLDYSTARPTAKAMRDFGAIGVLRYSCTNPANPKRLTRVEAQALRADGFWIGLVFEDGATRALAGRNAGKADALTAAGHAAEIGMPASCPLFFAVDEDLDPKVVEPYFLGVLDAHIPNPVGSYGSFRVVEHLLDVGIPYAWQTVAWSGGQRSTRAHLFQTNEHSLPDTDKNLLLQPVPLWGAPTSPVRPQDVVAPTPLPVPPHPIQEDNMALLIDNTDGNGFYIAPDDLKYKIPVAGSADLAALQASGRYTEIKLSGHQLGLIPDLKQ
jgi:hypothetical protein